jgi:hypothetical protein
MWCLACLVSLPFLVSTAGDPVQIAGCSISPESDVLEFGHHSLIDEGLRHRESGLATGASRHQKTEACRANQSLEGGPEGKLITAQRLNSAWSDGRGGHT